MAWSTFPAGLGEGNPTARRNRDAWWTGQALLLLEAGDGLLCPHETAPRDAPISPTSSSSRESLRSSEFLLLPASLNLLSQSLLATPYVRRVRVSDSPQPAVARERASGVSPKRTYRCPPSVVAAVAVARLARLVELAASPADVAPRHAPCPMRSTRRVVPYALRFVSASGARLAHATSSSG